MNSDKNIRDQFQSKFENYKVPLPADGWDRIEVSLNSVSSTNIVSRRFKLRYIGAAAAALLILVGSLLFFNNISEQNEIIISEAPSKIHDSNIPSQPDEVYKPAVETKELLAGNYQPVTHVLSKTTEKVSVEETVSAAANEIIYTTKQNEVLNIDKEDEEWFDLPIEEIIDISGENDVLFADNSSNRDREDLILSISGRGGLTSYQQAVNAPMTLRSAVAFDNQKAPDNMDKSALQTNTIGELESEMEHSQPVSFGITVSKQLFDDLYVETGLIYSFLYSRAKNSSVAFQEKETQKLHYLGVPLNLNYNIISLQKLNIYASVGGMIEKDIYGKYRRVNQGQSIEEDTQSSAMVDVNISQRNPQFSVNAGVGLSYPIYNDLRLYGKVGGSYYFDAKNQFSTIYSDRKIVMDLSLGVRYEF